MNFRIEVNGRRCLRRSIFGFIPSLHAAKIVNGYCVLGVDHLIGEGAAPLVHSFPDSCNRWVGLGRLVETSILADQFSVDWRMPICATSSARKSNQEEAVILTDADVQTRHTTV